MLISLLERTFMAFPYLEYLLFLADAVHKYSTRVHP